MKAEANNRLVAAHVFEILKIPESLRPTLLAHIEDRAELRLRYAGLLDALVEFGEAHVRIMTETISVLVKRDPPLSVTEWTTMLSVLGSAEVITHKEATDVW